MSEVKNNVGHSPAPLVIKFGGTTEADGFTIVSNNAAGHRGVVAECWPPSVTQEDRVRLAADAHLFKAAPDMLAALKLIARTGSASSKVIAKATIAKAEVSL